MKRSLHEWIATGSVSENIAKQRGYKEVIRCEDCKYYDPTVHYCDKLETHKVDNYFYCAKGKRWTSVIKQEG